MNIRGKIEGDIVPTYEHKAKEREDLIRFEHKGKDRRRHRPKYEHKAKERDEDNRQPSQNKLLY